MRIIHSASRDESLFMMGPSDTTSRPCLINTLMRDKQALFSYVWFKFGSDLTKFAKGQLEMVKMVHKWGGGGGGLADFLSFRAFETWVYSKRIILFCQVGITNENILSIYIYTPYLDKQSI